MSEKLDNYDPDPYVSNPKNRPPELEEALRDAIKLRKSLDGSGKTEYKPNTVYHYTSINALFSIIQNGALHFTERRFMNDPTEGELFLKKLLESLNGENHELWAKYNKYTRDSKVNIEDIPYPRSYFLMCFSKNPNSVAQWEMYAERGRGVCIEFDVNKLFSIIEPQLLKKSLEGKDEIVGGFEVNYENEEKSYT